MFKKHFLFFFIFLFTTKITFAADIRIETPVGENEFKIQNPQSPVFIAKKVQQKIKEFNNLQKNAKKLYDEDFCTTPFEKIFSCLIGRSRKKEMIKDILQMSHHFSEQFCQITNDTIINQKLFLELSKKIDNANELILKKIHCPFMQLAFKHKEHQY